VKAILDPYNPTGSTRFVNFNAAGAEGGAAGRLRAAQRDLDPQLVWRGKDEQDASDLIACAPPGTVKANDNAP
jgi:hypothetical protein